jgi:PAS domain S-box-containing protein
VRGGLTQRVLLASLAMGAVVLGCIAVLVVAYAGLHNQERNADQAGDVLAASNLLERSVLDLETGLRGYLLSGRTVFLQPYHSAEAGYPGQIRNLDQLTAGQPSLHGRAVRLGDGVSAYIRDWTDPVVDLSLSNLAAARAQEAGGGGKDRVDVLRRQFNALNSQQQVVSAQQRGASERTGRLTFILGVAGLLLAAVVITCVAVGLRRGVVTPVNRLAAAVGRLRRGDLSARVAERGTAEIGELSAGFNSMAEELEAARDEVEQQNAELQGQQAELQRVLASAERQKEEAEALQRFGEQLAAQTQIEQVAAVALREIADYTRAQVGAVYVLNEQAGVITFRASRGMRGEDFSPELAPGEGLAGRAAAEGRPVTAGWAESSMRLPGLVGEREVRHEVHLPMLHRDRVIGVLSLGRSGDEEFTPSQIDRLEILVQGATLACAEALSLRRLEVLAGELELVMDSTDQGICRVDLHDRITYINRAALGQTGWTEAELLGRNAHDAMHHTHPDGTPYPAADCPLLRAVRDNEGIRLSGEVFWRRDGSRFPVEASAYPIRDGGSVLGGVITFHDVSERRMAEHQLAAQYQTARVLAEAESVHEALPRVLELCCDQLGWQMSLVWVPGEDDHELHCLAAYARPGREEQLALLSHETVTRDLGTAGRAWAGRQPVFVPGLDGAVPRQDGPFQDGPQQDGRPQDGFSQNGLQRDDLLRNDRDGVPCGELAVPLTRDGEVMAVVQLLGPEQPRIDGLPETIETIAAQLSLYADRKRSDATAARMKDQFVSTVSHELRTPLAAMDGWLHILLDGEPGPLNEEQHRFLTTVKRNSDRLMRLVGDLLLIGQMDAGRFTLDMGDVDIAELVGETVTLFEGSAAEKGVELNADTRPRTVVAGDRLRLGQLLSNLVSNAVKFTPEGGQVWVRVGEQNGTCQVEVTDSGIGIPAADRVHLFERFYRASTATGTAGSGLGLAISKAIAEAHGGTIRIADSGGSGTRVVVEIPLHMAAEVTLLLSLSRRPSPRPGRPPSWSPMTSRTSASWSPTGSAGPATASSRPGTVRRRSSWPRTRRWTWRCWM